MKNTSFAIYTLGCKVNQYESEKIAQSFLQRGFKMVSFSDRADIYIVNTCAVTEESDRKSRKAVKKAAKRAKDFHSRDKNREGKFLEPLALSSSLKSGCVVVTGCCVDSPAKKFRETVKADVYVSNLDKTRMVDIVAKYLGLIPSTSNKSRGLFQRQQFHTRALVKVQDGCDEFCTYCVVPYARGLSASRKPEEVLQEVERLAASGTKEIVLTGVNLGKYGKDLTDKITLVELLNRLLKLPYFFRIRLSSIEVGDLSSELIEMAATLPRFCRHFHIPLQSGSDRILRAMGRKYRAKDYLDKLKEIKEAIFEVAITTDVMVGFPGETKRDFLKTQRLIEDIMFRKVHIFKFSLRYGTKAFSYPNQVSFDVKRRRALSLINLGEVQSQRFFREFVGRKLEVLVEDKSKNGYLKGVTDNYLPVYFKGLDEIKGKLAEVKILGKRKDALYGELLGERIRDGKMCILQNCESRSTS